MITGRQAVGAMERAISEARTGEVRLDQTLRSAEQQAARLRAERLEAFKALAAVKLDLIARNEYVGQLDAAERRAQQLLGRREETVRQLGERRETAARGMDEAQTRRNARAEDLEKAVHALDALTAKVVAEAQGGATWAERGKAAESARAVAGEADKKATMAEADRDAKGKPYEADPLFMYLWARKFGTADYASGFFVRFFDRKVAALIGYADARANYHMLNEIPLRLRAHAERAKAAADEAQGAVAAIEQEALDSHGGRKLVEAVEAARAQLEAAERDLAGRRASLMDVEKQRAAALQGDGDETWREAQTLLAEADSRIDLRSLQREAMQTPTTEDEAIVARIGQIDEAIAKADQEVAQIRTEARELARRRGEIEQVRDVSRQRGYDNPFGTFQTGPDIGGMIGAVLTGAMQGAILDRVLRDNYRERAHNWTPDFGKPGGGLNFPNWGQNTTQTPGGGNWTGNWSDWIGGGGGGGGGGGLGGGGDGGDFTSGDSF